jgi:putative transposase
MILAHKIRLEPTVKQEQDFWKACGCSRFTWNWALSEWDRHYKATGKSPNIYELKKRWNKEKPDWVLESPRDANSAVFPNLQKAFAAFFRKTAKHPRFKSKHKSRNSFSVANDKFAVDGNHVRLPKIGRVRMTEELRFDGKIMNGTVSERAGKWYLSISVDTTVSPVHGDEVIGIDLGLNQFAAFSTGEVLTAPQPLKKGIELLARRSRQHSRKMKGGRNREKSRLRLARLHARISDRRQDWLHKATTSLAARAKLLVVEDLCLSGMVKLWGRKMADTSLGEFRRQLTYKCLKNDCGLLAADRFFPSSQLCSDCGARHRLGLDERVFVCHACGSTRCRDLNAALNLHTLGLRGINACGHEGSGYSHTWVVKPSWLKQELNSCALARTH